MKRVTRGLNEFLEVPYYMIQGYYMIQCGNNPSGKSIVNSRNVKGLGYSLQVISRRIIINQIVSLKKGTLFQHVNVNKRID